MLTLHDKLIKKYIMWLILSDAPGLGPARIKQLFEAHGDIDRIINVIISDKESKILSKAKIFLESVEYEKYINIIKATYDFGAKICTLDDDLYPSNLKGTSNPPPLLYYKGHLDKLSPRSLALVGRVDPTENGIRRADKFASLCVQNNIQVISGLARGIDTASHKAALKYGGLTYAVVGHGIDYCYPSENKELYNEIVKNGAIISQFPTGTKPQRWMFPARNEVMCTISSGTVIIEATDGCGSLIQADFSFKHGRRVFILSSNLNNTIQNWAGKLLEKGAINVSDFETVTDSMESIKPEIFKTTSENNHEIKQQQSLFVNNKRSSFNNIAVLFDFDGVLFNASKIMLKAYKNSMHYLGREDISDEDILKVLKYSPPYVFRSLGLDGTKGNEIYKKQYLNLIPVHACFFNGIENVINELHNKGIKIGIVTSQPLSRYKSIMERCPFKNKIDKEVTWNDIPRNRQKPHPDGIFKALQVLNCKAEKSYYVGDTSNDMKAAINAGVSGVAVTWGLEPMNELKKSKYKFIVSTPEQLLDVIFKEI